MRTRSWIIQNWKEKPQFWMANQSLSHLHHNESQTPNWLHNCITQYIKQNYHWTDGFFVKNHPLKEAEKQCEFSFHQYGVYAARCGHDMQEGQNPDWVSLAWVIRGDRGQTLLHLCVKKKKYLHDRRPSVGWTGSKRLTLPFNLWRSSRSSCILQNNEGLNYVLTCVEGATVG